MFKYARVPLQRGIRLSIAKTGVLASFRGAWVRPTPLFIRAYSVVNTTDTDLESQIDEMTNNEYNTLANEYLEALTDDLEGLSEQYPQLDCEMSHGVLTIDMPPVGSYVINKQPPNKQIWLSSPITGPKRYDMIGGRWITLRDGSSLTELLQEEVNSTLNSDLQFNTEH
jgi:frataxin